MKLLPLFLPGTLLASALAVPSIPSADAPALAPRTSALDESTTDSHEGLAWHTDIDEARREAAASGKHVLVNFTGTGWCSWCKKLEKEVFSTAVFADSMAERYVLVVVDFGRDGSARTDLPFAKKNNELKEALGVDAFPTVALMTATGVAYGERGYERGGAGAYVEKLAAAHAEAAHLEEAVPRIAGAITSAKTPEEAIAAGDAGIQLLSDAGAHALGVPLVPLVRATLSSSEANSEREAKALKALSGANVVDAELIDRAFRVDPKNAAGLPEAALAAAMRTLDGPDAVDPLIARIESMLSTMIVHDKQVAAQLYGDCAYWIKAWQRDADRSRAMAAFALRLGPKDPDLRNMLQDLAGQ